MVGFAAGVPLLDFSSLGDIPGIVRGRRNEREAQELFGQFVDQQLGGQQQQPRTLADLAQQSPLSVGNGPATQGPATPDIGTVANGFADINGTRNDMFATASAANIQRESGGDPNARNPQPGQTAGGLMGFIDDTFTNVIKQHMPQLAQGRTDEEIAELKFDPNIATQAERFLSRDNARYLRDNGAPVNSGTIQLAHFLGAPDATRILQSDPNEQLTNVLSPAVIAANPEVVQRAGNTVGGLIGQFTGSAPSGGQSGGLNQRFRPQTQQQGGSVSNDTIRAMARNPHTRGIAVQYLQSRRSGQNPGFELREMPDGTVLSIDLKTGQPTKLIDAPEPQETFRQVTGEAAAAQGLDPNKVYNIGADNKVTQVGGAGTNVTVSTGEATATLRERLAKKEAEVWSTYIEQGTKASAQAADIEVLGELVAMAPQGPVVGRLAEFFPGVSNAGAAFNSIVKRLAPTMRAVGSGSTSDVEYSGMLKSLPQLLNNPEANQFIVQMIQNKAAVDMERAEIIARFSNDTSEGADQRAREAINELNRRSIMTPELRGLMLGLGPTPVPEPDADGKITLPNGITIREIPE